ncbi:MAG: tetratricopeptide repeat protein [Deltaproteobacteria bacterium]|nr:tetratricopeptide repeat protein [Deltaproteobacteria bacterium]
MNRTALTHTFWLGVGLTCLLPAMLGVNLLQTHNRHVEQGNKQFQGGKVDEALKLYDKALQEDGLADPQARAAAEFNRGTALSAMGKADEAAQAFLEATKSKDNSLRARAFYNLGNTFIKGEKFSEAVEAFKRSLVLEPRNNDAKWNLELALRKKKEQDEKNKNDDKDKKSDPNNKDKNGDKTDPSNKPQDGQDKSGQNDTKPNEENKPDDGKPNEPKPGEDQKQNPQEDGQGQQNKPDEPAQEKPEDKPSEQAQGAPEQQPKPSPAAAAQPDKGDNKEDAKGTAAEMKEINAILDSLEQSPRQIEQQRARVRAMQRRAPVKDW